MTLLRQVIEPFIQDYVASPPAVELFAMLLDQLLQRSVSLGVADSQYLGELAIEISTHGHIRVNQQSIVCFEMV